MKTFQYGPDSICDHRRADHLQNNNVYTKTLTVNHFSMFISLCTLDTSIYKNINNEKEEEENKSDIHLWKLKMRVQMFIA